MHSHQNFVLTHLLVFCLMLLAACTGINKADGSFEESSGSGRLHANLDGSNRLSKFHFFRLHIRQFDDVIGGVFEVFELNNYLAFSQEPEVLDRKRKNYYCSRIDHSYLRSKQIFITMTDREQRRWMFSSQLGDVSLYGRLDRLSYDDRIVSNSDYLLPEDVIYRERSQSQPSHGLETMSEQLVFDRMERNVKPLDCIYYHKKSDFKLELPNSLQLDTWCQPSSARCDNIRVGIIVTQLVYDSVLKKFSLSLLEHQSARLDDCDIDPNGNLRSLSLREKPEFTSPSFNLATATVIVYEDLDGNALWTQDSEPILAYASQGMLIFYDEPPQNLMYAKLPNGKTHDKTLFNKNVLSDSPGWHFVSYHSVNEDENDLAHFVTFLESQLVPQIKLNPIHLKDGVEQTTRGCYLKANLKANQSLCPPIFPAIAQ